MSKEDKINFLLDKGWSQWYNDNYWVHTKTIRDTRSQDYTNYGMSLDDAYDYEINNKEPFGMVFPIKILIR